MSDGDDDDVINNNNGFVILILTVVVFEILLAWLVVAMLLVILVLTMAVLEKLLEFGIYNGSATTANMAANFRHCKDLAFVLVMIFQMMTTLFIIVVMFRFG